MSVSISTAPRNPWLLVSDIDYTLTGDEEALAELLGLIEESPGVRLAVNSSRPRASVERTLASFPVPFEPAGMITAMGTEVAAGAPLGGWQERFAGWDRSVVDEIMAGLGAVAHDDEFQTRYKASYAVEGAAKQEAARQAIAASGQDCRVVISGASDMDVLPPGAGKGEATLFLARELGIDVGERLVVAGDSGNDVAMFEVSPRGILVGNAGAELREAVRPGRAYQARAPHAAGILEGLRHWGVPLGSTASRAPI